MTSLVERLRGKRQLLPVQGGASLGTDGLGNQVSTSYITDDGMRFVNPDGPEAADAIEAMQAEIERQEELVRVYRGAQLRAEEKLCREQANSQGWKKRAELLEVKLDAALKAAQS